MNNSSVEKMRKLSPLYEYWESEQNDFEEADRLTKSNKNSKAIYLFENEPYKWETLFQSIIRELIRGDKESVNGMQIILDCLKEEERLEIIRKLKEENLISEEIMNSITKKTEYHSAKKKNLIRFLRILFSIFTNPYRINFKRAKTHSYEWSGYYINKLRSIFL